VTSSTIFIVLTGLLISGNQLDSGEWRTSFFGRLGLFKARQFQILIHYPVHFVLQKYLELSELETLRVWPLSACRTDYVTLPHVCHPPKTHHIKPQTHPQIPQSLSLFSSNNGPQRLLSLRRSPIRSHRRPGIDRNLPLHRLST